jgi:hypothetical protein
MEMGLLDRELIRDRLESAKPIEGVPLLTYCAWCGKYQGAKAGKGHQIRKNVCEIDTATICPSCLAELLKQPLERQTFRA